MWNHTEWTENKQMRPQQIHSDTPSSEGWGVEGMKSGGTGAPFQYTHSLDGVPGFNWASHLRLYLLLIYMWPWWLPQKTCGKKLYQLASDMGLPSDKDLTKCHPKYPKEKSLVLRQTPLCLLLQLMLAPSLGLTERWISNWQINVL